LGVRTLIVFLGPRRVADPRWIRSIIELCCTPLSDAASGLYDLAGGCRQRQTWVGVLLFGREISLPWAEVAVAVDSCSAEFSERIGVGEIRRIFEVAVPRTVVTLADRDPADVAGALLEIGEKIALGLIIVCRYKSVTVRVVAE